MLGQILPTDENNRNTLLHHGMQSFHIIVYCTPDYCTLVYCTIADRSDRFATSISLRLREHANERYAIVSMSRNEGKKT